MAAAPHRVYLDYNATAPLRPEAVEAVREALDGDVGNPSSVHREGRAGRALVERARSQVAAALGAHPRELVFTASATEANNAAIVGAVLGPRGRERRTLVCTAAAHPSVLGPGAFAARHLGATAHVLPVGADGRVDPAALRACLDGGALLVSILAANNETGVVAPLAELAEPVHAAGAWLHVDATQALGRVPCDVAAWRADLATVSSHKVGGPAGAGALWVRPGVELAPVTSGGHQERNRRAGTEAAAVLAGFGAAVEAATVDVAAEALRLATLRDRLWTGLRDAVPDLRRVGEGADLLPNTLCVVAPGADGEVVLMALDLAGVAASTGSACTAGSLEPSPVLLAMGVPEHDARGAVRLSLGWATTAADVDNALELVPAAIASARTLGAP